MTLEEQHILKNHFPAAAVPLVEASFRNRFLRLVFKRPRRSKYGDFRPSRKEGAPCLITLNGDLHPYQTLITFVHELAHYEVFVKYGNRVRPHGEEWKSTFFSLMQPYLVETVFPEDVLVQLKHHLKRITASSSADVNLNRVLKSYEVCHDGFVTVEQIREGEGFITESGTLFLKGPRLRKRYKCFCPEKKQYYLVGPLLEVRPATEI